MNRQKRQKLTASVLTFVMLFQIIAGVFAPVNIFNLKKNEAHAGWFDAQYGYRKLITVDHTKVAGDLTNFLMLVSLTDPLLKVTGNGGRVTSASGYDIIFTNAAGSQKLDHEIEKYDAATGQIIMWVKVPVLSSSTDTNIYMYYGNSSITATQENKTGVWDDGGANNFKGVWHLKETGTGAAGDYKDSTQFAGNSTNTAGQPALATGFIGSGQSFNGTSQQISLGGSQVVTSATFSTWVYRSASEISYAGILFSRGTNVSGLDVYAATNDIGYHWNDANASFMFDSGLNLPLNKWVYTVLTVTPTTATFYMGNNGTVASAANTMTHAASTIDALTVGQDTAVGSRYFTGSIDEARFSNVARSSQWISTEYNNQSSPTEFSSLGIEEVSSPTALSSFGYRKAITIDHTKVAGDLVNFPVLINLPTDTSLAAHAQADNDDILFTSNSVVWNTGTVNDKLAFEIESYNSTTGSLQAWVKIPNLSSTADTVIYMYYGNATAASQQNKTAVWDSNTKMVQHMNQTGTGAAGDYKDSTQFVNNSYNTASQPTVTSSGKIGSAESFNGTSQYISVNDSTVIRPSGNLTFGAWVNPAALGGYFLDKSTAYNGYGLTTSGTQFLIQVAGWSNTGVTGPTALTNTWQYVVVTFERPNVYFYYNGVRYGPFSRDAAIESSGNPLVIGGAYSWQAADGYQPRPGFNGSIDEVHISNVARSSQWISTEYNNQFNPTEFLSLGIEEVASPAALSSFGYRKAITIDHTKVAGDLANFPVLINLPTDASLAAHAQADADDILFASSNIIWGSGTVNDKLASEIESYNSTTGSLQAWVKIPNLSSTADTVIYMYYGNGSVATQQNKTAVWDSSMKTVLHLKEVGSGVSGDYKDSTQYAKNSTNTANQPTAVTGQISGAESFNGSSNIISTGNNFNDSYLKYAITVSAWFKTDVVQSGPEGFYITSKKQYSLDNRAFGLKVNNQKVYWGVHNDNNDEYSSAGTSFSLGQWVNVVGTWNNGVQKTYVNGVEKNSITQSFTKINDSNSAFLIGAADSGANHWFSGAVDEVHVSSAVRTASWISTEYNNQSSPIEFSSLGIEEVSSPTALSSFGYRKAITIDHTKVAGDLTNFPVLINLPSDASLAAHAQADADDILFTSNSVAWNTGTVNDKLAHEIETYTTATGSLQSWVKISNLSSTTDTVIYMYYGNGSIATQQNKTVVWDANTKMVQHMNQNPGGTAPQMTDSTQNQTNGTSGGGL